MVHFFARLGAVPKGVACGIDSPEIVVRVDVHGIGATCQGGRHGYGAGRTTVGRSHATEQSTRLEEHNDSAMDHGEGGNAGVVCGHGHIVCLPMLGGYKKSAFVIDPNIFAIVDPESIETNRGPDTGQEIVGPREGLG